MRKILLPIMLCIAVAAYAQEGVVDVSEFSVELGCGFGPMHMNFPGVCPTSAEKNDYWQQGKTVYSNYEILFPEVDLSVAWRFTRKWEVVLTGGISWTEYTVNTHDQFGIDPYGSPRYDFAHTSSTTKKLSKPYFNSTLQARVLWNPESQVKVYTGFGAGVAVVGPEWAVFPALTPIGVRFGKNHLYGFVENAFTTNAFILHGGAGWRF